MDESVEDGCYLGKGSALMILLSVYNQGVQDCQEFQAKKHLDIVILCWLPRLFSTKVLASFSTNSNFAMSIHEPVKWQPLLSILGCGERKSSQNWQDFSIHVLGSWWKITILYSGLAV